MMAAKDGGTPPNKIPFKTDIVKRLRFTGDPSDVTVLTFLKNVSVLTTQFNADWEALKVVLPLALTDHALDWYVENADTISDLEDFCKAIKTAFIGADYKVELNKEFVARTQAPEESLRRYTEVMKGLARQVDPKMAVGELLRYIWSGMTPEYRRLNPVPPKTHKELDSLVLELDATVQATKRYSPPDPKNFPLSGDSLPRAQIVVDVRQPSLRSASASQGPPGYNAPLRSNGWCDLCSERGHWARVCPRREEFQRWLQGNQ